MMAIAYSYANLIQHGIKEFSEVPDIETLREDVQTILNNEDPFL